MFCNCEMLKKNSITNNKQCIIHKGNIYNLFIIKKIK